MSVHLFIVTHNKIGQEILETVASMFDIQNINIQTISIPSDITAAQLPDYKKKVNSTLQQNPTTDKLILCDVYGATPYNLVKDLIKEPAKNNNTTLITGLNLAMLLKAVQMTELPLNQIAQQALQSAQKSIILE